MSILGSLIPAGMAVNMVSKMVQSNRANTQTTFPEIEVPSLAERTVQSLDGNGDGVVSRDEFLLAQGVDPEDATGNTLFDRVDTDKDGVLTVGEMNAALAERQLRLRADEHAQTAMLMRDANGDGALSAVELPLDEEHFAQVDTNADGFIEASELANAHYTRAAAKES